MVKAIACPEERERIAAQVLAALPDWFGTAGGAPPPTSRDSRDLPFWADVSEEGEVRGFIALRETSPYTGEVYVMGVMPQYHRRGVGRALLSGSLCRGAAAWVRVSPGQDRPGGLLPRV